MAWVGPECRVVEGEPQTTASGVVPQNLPEAGEEEPQKTWEAQACKEEVVPRNLAWGLLELTLVAVVGEVSMTRGKE
jgi:hypothetical protein